MGRVNTDIEREATLDRVLRWSSKEAKKLGGVRSAQVQRAFYAELRDYFALCCIGRGSSQFRLRAERVLFSKRVILENWIERSVESLITSEPGTFDEILKQGSFGASKKQGVSLRFPLSSCQPTKLCGNLCYAHDVLDAAAPAVVRGVLNGVVAKRFEREDRGGRERILDAWGKHVTRAVQAALLESEGARYSRKARIRFGHVGDGAEFADFSNAIGRLVIQRSNGQVVPVIYTRHSSAVALDPSVFVVNFTLDPTSADRASMVPKGARIVFSAFGGVTSENAEVNFLEHHRFTHVAQVGSGRVCPATEPATKERSCDAVKCDRCFKHPR